MAPKDGKVGESVAPQGAEEGKEDTDRAEYSTSETLSAGSSDKERFASIRNNVMFRRLCDIVTWTPKRCRWDPENPPHFSTALNVLFGFSATFTVANLYYNQPILNILAEEFNVSYERISLVPTLMQAGYACGLLFICPVGDIVRRRAMILILVFFTATVWLGLCLTKSFSVFVALSFITGLTTVTPQLMLPLAGDLAPPHRRATAVSIVVSGLMLGMLIARLLAGILTNYTSWRTIYYLAFGLQYLIFALLFFFLPDYPSTNPEGITYPRILYSIGQHLFTYPTLVQSCLIGLVTGAIFTNFWTTLTFLLASEPYNLSPIMIGLYSLIGLLGILAGPPISRILIDRYTTLFSVFIGLSTILLGVCIGTYTGTLTLAGSVIQALVMDVGITTAQIANRSAIYAIAPKARNRVNTAYMVALFCGQLMGTAMGNRLYAEGGWIASGSASVGFACVGLLIAAAKGPWTDKWFGWKGGFSIKRRDLGPPAAKAEVAGDGTGGDAADVEKAGDGEGGVDGGGERGAREAESERGRVEKEDGKLPSHIQGR